MAERNDPNQNPQGRTDPRESPVEEHPVHEPSDVNTSLILKFGAGMVVAGLMVHLIILGLYAALAQHAKDTQPRLSPLVKEERKELPRDLKAIPEPRLQEKEVLDLAVLKRRHLEKLSGYGWVDQQKGVVHIPIDKAMKMLAKKKGTQEKGSRP